MLEIGNTVVSFELFEHRFCCDLSLCKGQCCVEGDAGAPLTKKEVEILNNIYPQIAHLLSPSAVEIVEKQGVSYIDSDGDDVTSIVNNKECVFSYFHNGVCYCAIEKAFNQELVGFCKPISCYLYPVRIQNYPTFTAVNVHKWSCCIGAVEKGKKLDIPVYKFLEKPLRQYFGGDWYREVEQAAELYYKEFQTVDSREQS